MCIYYKDYESTKIFLKTQGIDKEDFKVLTILGKTVN